MKIYDAGKNTELDNSVSGYDNRRLHQASLGADKEKPSGDRDEHPKEKQVSFFGVKVSYSRAFGIAFLVLFVLLFFPGFGVSSAGVKEKKAAESAKGTLQGVNK